MTVNVTWWTRRAGRAAVAVTLAGALTGCSPDGDAAGTVLRLGVVDTGLNCLADGGDRFTVRIDLATTGP